MTRLFKKPVEIKEAYLKELEGKIFEAERALEAFIVKDRAKREELEKETAAEAAKRQGVINNLEAILVGLRAERANLEKPLIEREKAVSQREMTATEREKQADEHDQDNFEFEQKVESKLAGVQDLADEIGSDRTALNNREKKIKAKEDQLDEREQNHLIKVDNFNTFVKETKQSLYNREEAVKLRELNVESEKEHVRKKEEVVTKGEIALADKYQTLEQTMKRLK